MVAGVEVDGAGIDVGGAADVVLPFPLTSDPTAESSVGAADTTSPCLDDAKDAVEAVEMVGAGDGRGSLLVGGVAEPAGAAAVAAARVAMFFGA